MLIQTGVLASEGMELNLLQQITKYFFCQYLLKLTIIISLCLLAVMFLVTPPCTPSFPVMFSSITKPPRHWTSRLFLQKAQTNIVRQATLRTWLHKAASSPDSHNTAKRQGPFKVQLWQYIYIYIFIAITKPSSFPSFIQLISYREPPSSSTVMKMNGEIRKSSLLFWPPVLHLSSPQNPTTITSSLSLSHNDPRFSLQQWRR